MELGEKIKKYRLKAGLTQAKLGEKLAIEPRAISRWENGLAVPSATDMRKLCKALDVDKEELVDPPKSVKKNVPKAALDKTKQNYLKGITCAVAIIAKILRVLVYVGMGALVVCVILIPVFFNSFDIQGHTISIKGFEDRIELINVGETSYKVKMGDKEEIVDLEISTKNIDYILDNYSKTRIICLSEVAAIISIASLLLLSYILASVEKLARNIGNGKAFTMDNALLLRNIGYLMIAIIVVPFLAGIVPNAVMDTHFGENFGLVNVIEILIVFALSYLFEYGSALAKNSDIVLYDNKSEEM